MATSGSSSDSLFSREPSWRRTSLAEASRYHRAPGAVSSVGRAPARQAGGHWFEPSTAHLTKAPLQRGFLVPEGCARRSVMRGVATKWQHPPASTVRRDVLLLGISFGGRPQRTPSTWPIPCGTPLVPRNSSREPCFSRMAASVSLRRRSSSSARLKRDQVCEARLSGDSSKRGPALGRASSRVDRWRLRHPLHAELRATRRIPHTKAGRGR